MSQTWADTPLRLINETGVKSCPDIPSDHAVIHFAQSMACLHNTIFRSFNASYNQCLSPKAGTKEAVDFLVFNQILHESIEHHHQVEELYFFPGLEKLTGIKGIMDENIRQHRDFEKALDRLRDYAFTVNADLYDGEKMKEILNELGPVLQKHLHDEIPTLLSLSEYDSKALMELWSLMSKKAEASTVKSRVGIMMLTSTDNTFLLDGQGIRYPQISVAVLYLAKLLLQWPHAGAWRFAPCDVLGNPKLLPHLNPETK